MVVIASYVCLVYNENWQILSGMVGVHSPTRHLLLNTMVVYGKSMSGWIQLHRSLQKWEWYTDINTCHLFLHILLSANHKQTKWRGQTIKVGQLMTGRKLLSTETGLTEQQIRTCLKRLESTSEITITKHNKYSIITVTNWNQYQQKIDKSTSDLTSNQPATNQQLTTSNNVNNINNENKLINIGDFDSFWNAYGKIGNKQQAIKFYNKAIKEGVHHEEIIRGVREYQTYCRAIGQEQRYIKHASTWLNNKGWEDDYTVHKQAAGQQRSLSKHERAKIALGLA